MTRCGPVYRPPRAISSQPQARNPQAFVECVPRTASVRPARPEGLGAPRAKRTQFPGPPRSGRGLRAKRTQLGPHRGRKARTARVAGDIGFVFSGPCCAFPTLTPFYYNGYAHFARRPIGFVSHDSSRRRCRGPRFLLGAGCGRHTAANPTPNAGGESASGALPLKPRHVSPWGQ